MPIYLTNELSFQLPEALVDRTINVFALSDDAPSDFSLVIARDRIQAGELLESFVDKQVRLLSRQLQGFELLRRNDMVIDKVPALCIDYRWQSPNGPLHQKQVTFPLHEQLKNGRVIMSLTATFNGGPLPEWETRFMALLDGLRLRNV